MADVGKAARILDATNNRLTSIPSSIGSLISLQRLILAQNQLMSLPREITALTNLKARPLPCVREWVFLPWAATHHKNFTIMPLCTT